MNTHKCKTCGKTYRNEKSFSINCPKCHKQAGKMLSAWGFK